MARKGVIKVATCQFSVSGNIRRNSAQIRRQINQAKKRRADVVHFPECCLSGYVGGDFKSWDGFEWNTHRAEMLKVCDLAKKQKLWVIIGSAHRLCGKHLPHNSLYVIDPRGRIVERYDKRFCTKGDLRFFSPGDHFSVFAINGVRCGLLICYDVRFPELYREYRKLGVQCMFHSFWNARTKGRNIHTVIMRPSLQARAATNYMWVGANNSTAWYGSWPSVFIRPDGTIAASLKFNRAGVMVNTVDTQRKLYDASAAHRDRAMRGILHSGELVRDPRSRNRRGI